jgi:hypothetical protein
MKRWASRRAVLAGGLLWATLLGGGCGGNVVYLDVVVYNYWPRPIIDVFINEQWGGAAPAATADRAGGGGGTIAGVPIKLGPQVVKWTLDGPPGSPRLGDEVVAKAELLAVPADHRVLTIVIYPDEKVKLKTSRFMLPEDQIK